MSSQCLMPLTPPRILTAMLRILGPAFSSGPLPRLWVTDNIARKRVICGPVFLDTFSSSSGAEFVNPRLFLSWCCLWCRTLWATDLAAAFPSPCVLAGHANPACSGAFVGVTTSIANIPSLLSQLWFLHAFPSCQKSVVYFYTGIRTHTAYMHAVGIIF